MSTAEERMQCAIEELEQENRLLRARNERLERESEMQRLAILDTLKEAPVPMTLTLEQIDSIRLQVGYGAGFLRFIEITGAIEAQGLAQLCAVPPRQYAVLLRFIDITGAIEAANEIKENT